MSVNFLVLVSKKVVIIMVSEWVKKTRKEIIEKSKINQNNEPAAPIEIGDLQVIVPINNHKLKAGYDVESKMWFVQLLNSDTVIFQRFSKQFLPENSKIFNDLKIYITDLELVPKKEARKALTQIFARITPSLLNFKNSVTCATCATCATTYASKPELKKNFFSDPNLLPKKYNPSVGFFSDKYYFGFNLIYPTPMVDSRTGEIIEVDVEKLTWVFEDHSCSIIDNKFIKDNRIKLNNVLFQKDMPRWSLSEIKSFVEYEGMPKNYKVVEPKELFERIRALYKKYVDFSDEESYDLHAIWDIGTYFFTIFDCYPYINLWGLRGSGKSKVMACSSLIAYNPEQFVNMTPATLFRIIEQNKPTLYIDEAENLWKQEKGEDDTTDIVALLNAGWMKGARVPRMEKEDGKQVPKYFDVYCPKMLASIKGLKGALQDRCITQVMVRASKDDFRGDLWPTEEDEEFQRVRDLLYPFALKYAKQIRYLYSTKDEGQQLQKEFNLSNRDWQIWKPLLVIAKIIDDELYERLGKYAEKITQEKEIPEEDDWKTKIYESILEWVDSDEVKTYYISDLKKIVDEKFVERVDYDSYGNEYKRYAKNIPSPSYIGKLLNKIGFKKYRKRSSGKVGYQLSKKIIFSLLQRQNVVAQDYLVAQVALDKKNDENAKNDGLKAYNGKIDNTFISCGKPRK